MDVIFDASSLILLAKISLLRLVLENNRSFMTGAVQKEIGKKDSDDSRLMREMTREGLIELCDEPSAGVIDKFMKDFRLGKGEASTLIAAQKMKSLIATDDGLAIKTAKLFNIPFLTAIHFLVRLRTQKAIDMEESVMKLKLLAHYGRYQAFIIHDAEKRLKGEGGN